MIVQYIRVSTIEQNEGRQVEALKKYNATKTFLEKVSAKDTNRPELQAMLEFVREGDTVVVKDFSRLARSTRDLLDIVERLQAKGVSLVSDSESLDTSTATGKMMLTVIGAINEFERSNLLERQREGIALAKERGEYKGRKPVEVDDIGQHYQRYMDRLISKAGIAKELGIARGTLDRLFKQHKEEIV